MEDQNKNTEATGTEATKGGEASSEGAATSEEPASSSQDDACGVCGGCN